MNDLIAKVSREIAFLNSEGFSLNDERIAELLKECKAALQQQWVSVDCEWEYTAAEEYWKTSCGNAFALNDGSPEDNSFKHCCYCGGKLKAIEQEQSK